MSALKKSELVFAPHPKNPRFKNLTGQKFNYLTALGFAGKKARHSRWYFECDCGTIRDVVGASVTSGRTKSCGCHKQKLTRERREKHGMSRTPTYMSYRAAKGRCENPKDSKYQNYGGRGVKFLYQSFEEFFADMGERPSRDMTLDRIDTNGNYGPGLCRWASRRTQAHTRNDSVRITVEGKTVILASLYSPQEPANKKHNAARRIKKFNWPVMAALFAPAGMRMKEAIEYVEGKSYKELASKHGLLIPAELAKGANQVEISSKKTAA
jgi:hypothetical protein